MASAILKRDNLIRLMYCLARSCTKVTTELVLHYLSLAKPRNIKEQEWNIEAFLNSHRDGPILQNFIKGEYRKKVLFPGPNKHTNIDHWDQAALFTVLRLFQKVDKYVVADMKQMRMLRNKLFHWGLGEMADTDFVINKRKIEQFVDNCCKVIGKESIKGEVKVILENMEDYESIEKAIQTELETWKKDDILEKSDNHEPVFMSRLEEIYTKLADIIVIKEPHMPETNITLEVNNCNKETSSKASDILLQNIRGPPPECGPELRKLWDAIHEVLQKLLCDERSLLRTCKACVILTVQCPDFNSLKSLLEECMTGKLTATLKSVENILRHLYENDELTLEFTITNSDFWCCIEELGEKLTTAVHEQVGVDISPHLSPEIIMRSPTAQRDDITIKPKSYRHALEVSDVIQSDSLAEDFRKISTFLADIFGMNDVNITANLETTEQGLVKSKMIYTSSCDDVWNRNTDRTIELINEKEEKERTEANDEKNAVLPETESQEKETLIYNDVQPDEEEEGSQPELEPYPERKPSPDSQRDPIPELSWEQTPGPEPVPVIDIYYITFPEDEVVPSETEPQEKEIPIYNDVQQDEEEGNQPELVPYPERKPSPDSQRDPIPELSREHTSEPEPDSEPVVVTALFHYYHPLLCHLTKWPYFPGYGFVLHEEKDVPVHYIGFVGDGSPAQYAGVQQGDRIVEVNGENIESYTHQQVMEKIKSVRSETTLLVVDKQTDEYYKNSGIQITANLPEVISKSTERKEMSETRKSKIEEPEDELANPNDDREKLKYKTEEHEYKTEKLEYKTEELVYKRAANKNKKDILKYEMENLLEASGEETRKSTIKELEDELEKLKCKMEELEYKRPENKIERETMLETSVKETRKNKLDEFKQLWSLDPKTKRQYKREKLTEEAKVPEGEVVPPREGSQLELEPYPEWKPASDLDIMTSAIRNRYNLIRLMSCLAKSCTDVAKALVLHYLSLAKPSDMEEQEWNMDEFLNVHRDGLILHKFIKDEQMKQLLFPYPSKRTNINHWDLATLFTVLGLFQNVDKDIQVNMTHVRKLRNELFHWGSNEMPDADFDIYKRKIKMFVDSCCRLIDNESIKHEVKVTLDDMEEPESIEKGLHTDLEI